MGHKKYRDLIQDVFQGDQAFMGALDRASTSVINHREPKVPSKSPELLSRYCDALLKKSSKGISETEIEDKLAASITIFKYLDDKDVFQKFYSRTLGKRLIHMQCHSMDIEEAMINRLKQACGYEFTSKFHRMFEAFYSKQFSGRKLTWLHHLSNGDVKLGYTTKGYIINMSTTQMAVLLLFDQTDSLSYVELQETTKLADDQFPRYVQSLLDAKLLTINSETLSPDSVVSLNLKYTNKRTKFKIAGTVQKETPQEVDPHAEPQHGHGG